MVSTLERLVGGSEPLVKTLQLTEQQELKLRTLIEHVISNNYDFADNTCSTASFCDQSSLRVAIGTEPPNTTYWMRDSAQIIDQLNDIANELGFIKFHKMILPPSSPEASVLPSGLKATLFT